MQPKDIKNEGDALTELIRYLNDKGLFEYIYFSDLYKINQDKVQTFIFFLNLLKRGKYLFRIKIGIYAIEKQIPKDMTVEQLLIYNQY